MELVNIVGTTVANVANLIIEEVASSDEEEIDRNVLEKKVDYAEVTVPNFNSRQFKQHFRMSPETFESLLVEVHRSSVGIHELKRGQPELKLEKQTMMTIWCLANLESFRLVGSFLPVLSVFLNFLTSDQ